MDPIKSIGQKLRGDEQRDAIHIAIMPVVCADDYMRGGKEVGLVYGTKNTVKHKDSVYRVETIGVLDPFLKDYPDPLKKGDVVWCFLKPGTITGLRHEWFHPDIDGQHPPANESEKWLREFADKWNFPYDEMITAASNPHGDGEFDYNYIVAQGIDLHSRSELAPGDEALFWEHIGNLTGFKADEKHREKFGWSCPC